VIIVARGGGSIEDLWGFNDEDLVRAVAASEIPVVSAVGHETDWTLIDFAADIRAPTPTGAAEMVVPVRAELSATVNDLSRRHAEAMLRRLERLRSDLRSVARALPGPDDILSQKRQRLDIAAARLPAALRSNARAFEARLSDLRHRLERASPRVKVARARARLEAVGERPANALQAIAARQRQSLTFVARRFSIETGKIVVDRRRNLESIWKLANSLGHKSVLARGYVIVRDAAGKPLRVMEGLVAGDDVTLEFKDGNIGAKIHGNERHQDGKRDSFVAARPAPMRRETQKPSAKPPVQQRSLFD
jgi:exodeoxyribonuclease VII large subunit